MVISVKSCTTSKNCCVSYTTGHVFTSPAALANSVNVFNVVCSNRGLFARALKLGFSMIGAGGVTSLNTDLNPILAHPLGTSRRRLVRGCIGQKCGLFMGHYTRNEGVSARTVRGITRNHM